MQILLNSLRRLLTVVPQTEHTLSRWCGGPDGQRPGSPNAGPQSPNRDGPPPPGALTHDGPGMCAAPLLAQRLRQDCLDLDKKVLEVLSPLPSVMHVVMS